MSATNLNVHQMFGYLRGTLNSKATFLHLQTFIILSFLPTNWFESATLLQVTRWHSQINLLDETQNFQIETDLVAPDVLLFKTDLVAPGGQVGLLLLALVLTKRVLANPPKMSEDAHLYFEIGIQGFLTGGDTQWNYVSGMG